MPTQISITAYKFAELSDKAKGKVRERWRTFAADDFDPDYLIDDFVEVLTACGLNLDRMPHDNRKPAIYYTAERGTYWIAAIAGTWRASEVNHAAVESIVKDRPTDTELHSLMNAIRQTAITFPHSIAFIQCVTMYMTSVVSEFWIREHAGPDECTTVPCDDYENFEQIVKDLCHWFARQVEAEYEYRQSVEAIDESIEANAPDALYHADGTEIKQP